MLPAGTVIGSYRILAPLGAGGMGEVYRAHDLNLARDVALKVIRGEFARDRDLLERFTREARAAGALSHPNVCVVHNIGSADGSPYIVMELLDGESLRARLRKGPVPQRKALEWVAQAARGIAAAHSLGIVHRDLKPENLFLTTGGRIKVLDFGLAKLTRPEAAANAETMSVTATATAPGTVLGTAAYMAPEQVRGEIVDQRADVFSLGAILYELLTGRRAFAGTALPETVYRVLNEDPPPLSAGGHGFPPALERVVGRCLEKQPAERFQSALDLAFALEGIETAAVPVASTGAGRGARRWPRRLVAGAAVAALAGLGYLAGVTGHGRGGDARPILDYERLTVDRGRVFSARFVTGTGSMVYAAAWGGQPAGLYEVRPGFSGSRALDLRQAVLQSVTRDGRMAVILDQERFVGWTQPGTLAEVPLPDGQPREILDEVLAADWAPDGRTLAVAHLVQGKTRLEMPLGQALYECGGRISCVRVAPSGEWVACVENPVPPDTRGSVVVIDRQGHVRARTPEWNSVLGLAWAHDGRDVWFCATTDGAATDLQALRPDGATRVIQRFPGYMVLHDIGPDGRLLLAREHITAGIRGRAPGAASERELGWLDWSTAYDITADGRTMLFDEQGIGGGNYYSVWLRGLDGATPVRLGEGHGCAISPDRQTVLVAYMGLPNRLSLVPTGPGTVAELPRGAVERYQRARWLPDGSGFVIAAAATGRAWRTWYQDAHGAPPRPVTPEGIVGVSVSPDSRIVAATDQDHRLFVCPLAGGEPRAVARLQADEIVIDWSADGREIIVGDKGTAMDLTRIDIVSGRREPYARFEPSDPAGTCVWNAFLARDAGAYVYSYFRWVDELYLVDGLD